MSVKKFILAGYDISGIQDFIFSSNKLKENISASNIVHNILAEDLPNLIETYAKNNNLKIDIAGYKMKNDDYKRFKMLDDDELEIEIIYIGGGNAFVAYRSKEIGVDITKHFSKMVFNLTYSLSVAVGYVYCTNESCLIESFLSLNEELNKNKAKMIRSLPMQNISITKNDVNAGYPIIDEINNELFTQESKLKLQNYDKEYFKKYLPSEKLKYITDIDQLVVEKGKDSFIGVVHIDGNNMGKSIREIMKCKDDKLSFKEQMHDYVSRIRRLSNEVKNNYENAFMKMLDVLIKYECSQNDEEKYLPIRPIILNGDDITFVCKGKYALSLTEILLKEVNKQVLNYNSNEYKQSACAGIYFVHSHFPFHIAYELAEQACSNAKRKAKLFARKNGGYVGSWIDFDISYSGLTLSLHEARKKKYNLPELDKVELFKHKEGKYEGYNLINRPYYVTEETENKAYEFNSFKKLINHFNNEWPRNKVKELRNAFMKSKVLVERLIAENKSRNRKLYDSDDIILGEALNTGFDPVGNYSPFFDALEIIDLYENIGGDS